jgi:glycosyltransferase involved in cell wall biosynthesis
MKKEQPTIIHYIDNFHIGGAQTMLMELFYSIDKHSDYKQIVYCANSSKIARSNASFSYNINVGRLKNKEFIRRILDHKPCVLIYHKLLRSDTTLYKDLFGSVPIFVINHTFAKPDFKIRINKCNYIISVCKSMLTGMQKHKKRCRGKMVTIMNSVDFDRYDNISPVKSRYDRRTHILTGRINTFNKWKYSDGWIKWCVTARLPKKMIHDYIGEGSFLKRARKNYSKMKGKRNRIIFRGFVTEFEEKVSIMKSWDLFLYQINEQEGLSVSVLESLACGVPVICSNHFGNKEVIEKGINGYVFKTKHHARDILERLCNNPDELKKLKKTTREHFRDNLSSKKMSKSYLNLIEQVYYGKNK